MEYISCAELLEKAMEWDMEYIYMSYRRSPFMPPSGITPRGWPWVDQPDHCVQAEPPCGFQEPSIAAFGPCSELWNLQGLLHGPVCPAMKYVLPFFEESWLEVFLLWVAVCLQRTCGKWGLLKQFVCDFSASSASSAVAFSAYIHHLFWYFKWVPDARCGIGQ